MKQLTLFSKNHQIKSLLEELDNTPEFSSRCRITLDKIAELIDAEFQGSDLVYKETGKSVDIYKIHKEVGFLPKTSMQYRLNAKGIDTVHEGKDIFLVYQGQKIPRPQVGNCVATVKRTFGIDI